MGFYVPGLMKVYKLRTVVLQLFKMVLLICRVRTEIKHTVYRIQGKEGYDQQDYGNTSTRSVLAYNHNDSSLDGGLNRINVGISTSTTSRSTSKSSSMGLFRPDGYLAGQHSLPRNGYATSPGNGYAHATSPGNGYATSPGNGYATPVKEGFPGSHPTSPHETYPPPQPNPDEPPLYSSLGSTGMGTVIFIMKHAIQLGEVWVKLANCKGSYNHLSTILLILYIHFGNMVSLRLYILSYLVGIQGEFMI